MDALKAALIKAVVAEAMAELALLSSFFALPVINPIVMYFVTQFVTYLVNETALGLSLLWITLNISYEVDTVENATDALKKMLLNPKDYSNDQMAQISKQFDDAADKLISLASARVQ